MWSLFPTRTQWNNWSKPSKYTAAGLVLGILAFTFGIWAYFYPFNNSESPELVIKNLFADYELQGTQPEHLTFFMRGGAGLEVQNKRKSPVVLRPRLSPEGTVIFFPDHQEIQRVPGIFQLSQEVIDTRGLTIKGESRSKPAIEFLVSLKSPTNGKGVAIPAFYVYKIEWTFGENGQIFFSQCMRIESVPSYIDPALADRFYKRSKELLPCDGEKRAI